MEHQIIVQVEKYVTELFNNHDTSNMHFHNLEHTLQVVEAVGFIADKCGVDLECQRIGAVAAWFHDTGYLFHRENHEERSMNIAEKFLLSHHVDPKEIDIVKQCINVTKIPEIPKTQLEKVVKDADLYHLATKKFFDQSLLLRKEWKAAGEQKLNKENYLFETLEFMLRHQYYTNYGLTILYEKKKENIEKLKELIRETYAKKYEKKIGKLEEKVQKGVGTARGIETMFRATARNQISLSAMADNKSNILISVNSIILSVMVTYIVRSVDTMSHLLFPVVAMVVTNLLTIIFSVLATLPHLTKGKLSVKDIEEKKANLMFFGNFHNMDYKTYEWGMKSMMGDYDYLYRTLTKDQYELGIVLQRKYKQLRVAYFIFMFGLILTILLFLIVNL